jgi:hypothetical protein
VALVGVAACGPGPALGADRMVTAALAGRQNAELAMVNGADSVLVLAADLGESLFRAWTPADARVAPRASVTDTSVQVALTSVGGAGGAALTIELNTRVRWRIQLDGGASRETVAMDHGRLAGLDFGAGSARIQASLPVPNGTVPIQLTGGASSFDLRVPPTVPTQVRLGAGAGHATIDGVTHTGIAAGTVFTPDNWTTTTDRYLIDNTAGVSALTVNRNT